MVQQSTMATPEWQRAPVDLARREAALTDRSRTGGHGGPKRLGVYSATFSPTGIAITIGYPDGPKSYQWTWKQLDAGYEGTRVPFDRHAMWTPKELREAGPVEGWGS